MLLQVRLRTSLEIARFFGSAAPSTGREWRNIVLRALSRWFV
jgi:hypothetical protein